MDTEKLLENFENYARIFKKYFPDQGTDRFLEDFGMRLTTAPRGLTSSDGGEYGALIDHLTKVAVIAKTHADIIVEKLGNEILDKRSVTRVCLAHELGKVGSTNEDLFISQESQWHRDKLGQNFKYNENCPKMSVAHRTLCLLQSYGIYLTQDEWIAILTSQGMQYPENSFYGKSLPTIAKILHFAKSIVDIENI